MDQSEKTLLLAAVRRDLSGGEAAVADLRRRLQAAEEDLMEMRRVEAYVLRRESPQGGASEPSDEKGPSSLDPQQIATAAKNLLYTAGPGHPKRALEIAKEIDPAYDPVADSRAFENRVFSTMKRRSDTFARTDRGLWTLCIFVTRPRKAGFDFSTSRQQAEEANGESEAEQTPSPSGHEEGIP